MDNLIDKIKLYNQKRQECEELISELTGDEICSGVMSYLSELVPKGASVCMLLDAGGQWNDGDAVSGFSVQGLYWITADELKELEEDEDFDIENIGWDVENKFNYPENSEGKAWPNKLQARFEEIPNDLLERIGENLCITLIDGKVHISDIEPQY